ncbi:MAG: helix-turn-helix transcriptional regulator [bacterium]|nr:helix-turn-helix transcriptional regulator [bacterium]
MKKQLPITLRGNLKNLDESLKKARLRRRIKMTTVADRAGISRETLAKIQRGDPGVGIGNYAAVIFALGLGTEWMNLADITEDPVGQALDERRLPSRVRDTGA